MHTVNSVYYGLSPATLMLMVRV